MHLEIKSQIGKERKYLSKYAVHILYAYIFIFLSILFTNYDYTSRQYSHFIIVNLLNSLLYYAIIFICLKIKLNLKKVLLVVFVFTSLSVLLLNISYFINNGTFFAPSAADSLVYHDLAQKMSNLSFTQSLKFMSNTYGIDDFGFPFLMRLVYTFSPSPIFINILNIIWNLFSVYFIYYIGKTFLSERISAIVSIVIGTSLFIVFFQSTGLKEIFMVFIINMTLFFYYKFMVTKEGKYIVLTLVTSLLTIFFRIPILIFLLSAILLNELFITKRVKLSKKFSTIVLAFFILSYIYMYFLSYVNRYSFVADHAISRKLTVIKMSNNFILATNILSSIVGPLPTFFKAERINSTIYAGSLVLKNYLSIFFIFGSFWALKAKNQFVVPILLFSVFNIIGLIVVIETFETRLSMPHISLVILISFYGLFYFFSNIKQLPLTRLTVKIYNYILFFVLFFWNHLRI